MREHVNDSASDAGEGFLKPNAVMPAQFFAEPGAARGPERRLMAAVLEDAVRCYRRYRCASDRRSQRIHADAREWFESRDADPLFSFENICDTLGLDAHHVRETLRRERTAPPGDVPWEAASQHGRAA